MLLRRLALVLLPLASLITTSYSMVPAGVLDPPPGTEVKIKILSRPPPQVCKGAKEHISISYQYVVYPLAALRGRPAVTEVPVPAPASGSGSADPRLKRGDLSDSTWPIPNKPTGFGSHDFYFTAKETGDEFITFDVVLNGVLGHDVLSFEVIDCVYHVGIGAVALYKGGLGEEDFTKLTVTVVWTEGGVFTVHPDGTIFSVGSGEISQTYRGSRRGITCAPNTVSAHTSHNLEGKRDRDGLHLKFDFAPYTYEGKSVVCTVDKTKTTISLGTTGDLDTLSIRDEALYTRKTAKTRFTFFEGKGILSITSADPKALEP